MFLIHRLADTFFSGFGYPENVKRILKTRPEILSFEPTLARGVDHDSVVRWDQFAQDVVSMATGDSGLYGRSQWAERENLPKLSCQTVTEKWSCDIADVTALSSCKTPLANYVSLDALAEHKCTDLIEQISHENLAKNLAHREILIIHEGESTSAHFQRYDWDDRLFLINGNGAHHFAAARYIALRLPQPVTLQGKCCDERINIAAVRAMCAEFEIFALRGLPILLNEFAEAMSQFGAPWLMARMPSPYGHDCQAIFLPKCKRRSSVVAQVLRQAGAFDITGHLQSLCTTPKKMSGLL
ncbi:MULTISPECIES: DUF6685 family protein [Herbaspirillum]|uniref:Uncharacterized protein n=2 Tax=Herbaspirillum huttiense TaxID=863372 RepID=A0AAJ2HCT1_9BURK|nr:MULTISPECIES: DUF6685 family protein [Herbaspirillum]MDR9839678.1 hypothetical protein [Herbaspirillum huttiense]